MNITHDKKCAGVFYSLIPAGLEPALLDESSFDDEYISSVQPVHHGPVISIVCSSALVP